MARGYRIWATTVAGKPVNPSLKNETGIKRLVATVNWKISVYSSNIFILTKEPHQEADTSKLSNIQIIESDELKMLF